MGKKAAARAGKAPPTSSSASAHDEPVKINLYDSGALRGALDDCAREVVIVAGYDEDVSVSNVKIVLGLTAIGIALFAQFGPGKFPDTWWTVLGCVVVYTLITGFLHLYSWRHEGDAFLLTKPRKGVSCGVRLSSSLERYGEKYTLKMSKDVDECEVSSTWSIGALFHEDGYLAEPVFKEHVSKLLERWEAQLAAGGSKKDN